VSPRFVSADWLFPLFTEEKTPMTPKQISPKQKASNINLPRILRVGGGASGELAATLAELELSRPFLVTDPFMVECGYCARLEAALQEAGVAFGVFAECVPDPTTDSVYAALARMKEGDYDSVVALGGACSSTFGFTYNCYTHHGGYWLRSYPGGGDHRYADPGKDALHGSGVYAGGGPCRL
jgi:hypothetical protein